MAEQLRFKNLAKVAKDIRVMGKTGSDILFEGTIIDVVSYHYSTPAVLTVEGYLYDGTNIEHFVRDMPLLMLKKYDKEEFDVLERLVEDRVAAVTKAEICRKQFKRMLT